ncbi:hypothetical protein OG379_36530 [Streptomyces sp. NBC_01166]|uniref:hypothetical protein n=1 Tax=Streptomyces sp. NBC_01166 TaxID=2903755 RepID=UPI003865C7B2|nr:hypothetical protein OG379_36530 [Streptomyces sp. NBC_01166]
MDYRHVRPEAVSDQLRTFPERQNFVRLAAGGNGADGRTRPVGGSGGPCGSEVVGILALRGWAGGLTT